MREGILGAMGFEHLRVFQASELLDNIVKKLIEEAAPGHGAEISELRGCLASIPHNISEAYGTEHPVKKANYLDIARGSTDETRASLRRLADRGAFSQKAIVRPCVLCRTIAKMLTSWISGLREQN